MLYIHALQLIDLCVKYGLLKEEDGNLLVYLNKTEQNEEGWFWMDKNLVAKQLMRDKEGQEVALQALNEKGVEYVPFNCPWLSDKE